MHSKQELDPTKLAAIVLLAILSLVYAGTFYKAYMVEPAQRAAKFAAGMENMRTLYLKGSITLPPPQTGPTKVDQWRLQYSITGDEEARGKVLKNVRSEYRQEHRTKIVITLAVACAAALVALVIGLSMRQPGMPPR